MGHRDSQSVAGDFFDGRRRRRRRRIDPLCERCLEFVDAVEDALDDFYDDDHHCCNCCSRRGSSNYWGRDF